ncbi:MAG: hypothetical protein IT392_12465 [Nitrospirae bacterium]|nr:hypothetical protein [Nitrospirota bacterium]
MAINKNMPFDSMGIEFTSVPVSLDGATARGVLWQAAAGRFLLNVPDVARYLIVDGRNAFIEPAANTDEGKVRHFLFKAPLAAMLFQRGVLAFHAAAAATQHGAILFAGDSGSGKSTLLAALLKRGWEMLSDDLVMVDLDEHERPVVFPVCQDILLWPDAMEKLKIAAPSSKPHDYNNKRSVIPQPGPIASDPKPLRAIYWLSVHNRDEIEIKELEGTERFSALGLLSYNSHIADALFDRTVYFRKAAAVSGEAPLKRLRRPRGRWSIEELADMVVSEWQ